MKNLGMDIDWRTIQVFLSPDGVFEVEVDNDNHAKARCNCPMFRASAKCKHVRYVRRRMEENDGHYSILIPYEISEDEALSAMQTSQDFRAFVLRHARVEVID
jgi:hypothetical protein